MKGLMLFCLIGIFANKLNALQDNGLQMEGRLPLRKILKNVPPIQAQIVPFEAQSPIQVQIVRQQEMEKMPEQQQVRPQQQQILQEEEKVQLEQPQVPGAVIAPPAQVVPVLPVQQVRPPGKGLIV